LNLTEIIWQSSAAFADITASAIVCVSTAVWLGAVPLGKSWDNGLIVHVLVVNFGLTPRLYEAAS
jgi:hypothetical protein